MNDEQLGQLLRAALPPTEDTSARRDVWPSLVERLNERPRWSLLDVGLGIAAALALIMTPERLWFFAYHL